MFDILSQQKNENYYYNEIPVQSMRMTKIFKTYIECWQRYGEIITSYRAVGMQKGTITLETSLAVSKKVKHTFSM